MAGSLARQLGSHRRRDVADPRWLRWGAIGFAVAFTSVLLLFPLGVVVWSGLQEGLRAWWEPMTTRETRSAIGLTLLAAAIAVPLNTVFGVAAAWLVTRHRFRGRSLLLTLIDIPFAVSPVIAGMLFVLLLGTHGLFGEWVQASGLRIIFAPPGIVIATMFVTFPFVARELIPVMQAIGPQQELAALTLGASPLQMFLRVTLPNIRWALLFGVVLCTARAMGEFGAVSVVSGHIRGMTNTVPLHIEILYNEYEFVAAYAVSTLLVGLAGATLALRAAIEAAVARRTRRRGEAGE